MLLVVFAASYALAQGAADKRRSGYQDMGEALQKMQDDNTANPGMLFVQLGEQLWSKPAGAANKACADCHASGSMKSVAARYPAIPKDVDKPVDLEGRVNLCHNSRGCRDRIFSFQDRTAHNQVISAGTNRFGGGKRALLIVIRVATRTNAGCNDQEVRAGDCLANHLNLPG